MDIEHCCPEVQVKDLHAEPVLDRDALIATLLDRMVPLQIFQRRPYTLIQIRTWYNGQEYETFGFSHMKSGWNEDRASDLAIKKAILMAYVQVRSRE